MNLVLFHTGEIGPPLPRNDPRAQHILKILRRQIGDAFDVGLPNGPRGKATLHAITESTLILDFQWDAQRPPLPPPTTLLIGLPRPQTARKILQEATALGVRALHFVRCERSEPSYAQSSLWLSGEWHRHLEAGSAQAFATDIPELSYERTLSEVLSALPACATNAKHAATHAAAATLSSGKTKNAAHIEPPLYLALDNYEAPLPLAHYSLGPATPLTLALGPERGWTAAERASLRRAGFDLAHLGPRVLRLETAVTAALAITHANRSHPR